MNLLVPAYVLPVGISIMLALFFPVTGHLRQKSHRAQYYFLQGITLLGAVFGAKISVLFGDYHWPWAAINDWRQVLSSGRSITGALIFGFLFAETAKPLIGYIMPPNDRFATILPFTIGIGRIGCLMAGCCGGLPYNGWCAIRAADGISRYPTQVLEMVFQFSIGALFILLLKRRILFGRLFSLYLVIYGVFRFLTEFLRDTPKFFGGLSGYQMLGLLMILLGATFLIKRTIAQPASWQEFKPETSG
jgi:phosphatidylglycerol---prolipoprotein diacylglyceryl transferase